MYDLENLDWNSQLKIKALNDRIKALESGKAYADLKSRMELQRARYERELSRKDTEIAALHRQLANKYSLIQHMMLWLFTVSVRTTQSLRSSTLIQEPV